MHPEQADPQYSNQDPSLEQLEREAAQLIQVGLEKMQERYGADLENILKAKSMAAWSKLANNTFGKS